MGNFVHYFAYVFFPLSVVLLIIISLGDKSRTMLNLVLTSILIFLYNICRTSIPNVILFKMVILELLERDAWQDVVPRKLVPTLLYSTYTGSYQIHSSYFRSSFFLTIADSHISCKTKNMQLSFGSMTIELNICNVPKQA